MTGANSVKVSARAATVEPVAKTPAARAMAPGIQAVLTCIALPPSKNPGLAGDPDRRFLAFERPPLDRQTYRPRGGEGSSGVGAQCRNGPTPKVCNSVRSRE